VHSGTAVWIDGEVRDAPAVSPLDHGFLVGDGVFETIKTVDGQPFALTRHLRRLERSADGLGLALPPEATIRSAVADVLAVSAAPIGRLRITVTSGTGPLGSARGEDPPTLVVTHAATTPWPPSTRLATVPWSRNERGATAGLKTTSYADNVVALRAAREQSADEAIFTDTRGRICEGTGTNIFYVLNGHLTTPSLATGCLAGITRGLIIEVADVMVADAPIEMLADVDEAFVTSSTRDVQPVSHIDGRALRACPGRHTSEAMAAFAALATRTVDP
jgi:branched-chain amino acid aminotransferase